jgi:hypothetical protein
MAVFANLEVFLVEALYRFAIASGHNDVEQDGAGIRFEDQAAVFVWDCGLGAERRCNERAK